MRHLLGNFHDTQFFWEVFPSSKVERRDRRPPGTCNFWETPLAPFSLKKKRANKKGRSPLAMKLVDFCQNLWDTQLNSKLVSNFWDTFWGNFSDTQFFFFLKIFPSPRVERRARRPPGTWPNKKGRADTENEFGVNSALSCSWSLFRFGRLV